MKYLNQFFSLKCCGDVLSAVAPITNGAKEITEAMSMRAKLKHIVLADNQDYALIDLCSGNCLVPVLSAFTFPRVFNIAVDLRPRPRQVAGVHRLLYRQQDINLLEIYRKDALIRQPSLDTDPSRLIEVDTHDVVILTAMHACGNLSKHIIDLFLKSCAKHLILCPCCIGKGEGWFYNIAVNCLPMGKHEAWCLYLAGMLHEGGVDDTCIIKDTNVLSARNLFIVAHKSSITASPGNL